MKTIMAVAINGRKLLFDNVLSEQEYIALQSFADSFLSKIPADLSDISGIEPIFIDAVKTELNICLNPVKISHVVRIR